MLLITDKSFMFTVCRKARTARRGRTPRVHTRASTLRLELDGRSCVDPHVGKSDVADARGDLGADGQPVGVRASNVVHIRRQTPGQPRTVIGSVL